MQGSPVCCFCIRNCDSSEEILLKQGTGDRGRGAALSFSLALFSQYSKRNELLRQRFATEVPQISRGRDNGAKILTALSDTL